MSNNTWKLVAASMFLMASAVVASSLITSPRQAAADSNSALTAKQSHTGPTPMPALVKAEVPVAQTAPAEQQIPDANSWTVTVVHGDTIEQITYKDPESKARIATREFEQNWE